MRDFAKISCSIWHSRKFRSLPNDDCRLVYLYLHTNPHVNSLGCYVLPFGYAIADLGWNDMETDPIRYRDCIASLCDSGLIGFDPAESVVRIVDFLKHSPFSNEKHAKGAIKILYHIPDCADKLILINELRGMKHVPTDIIPSLQDRVSDTVSKPCRYTETETRDQRPRVDGGGSAQARDPLPSGPTWREQMLDAMGVDPSGLIGANGKVIGQRVDLDTADRWQRDLGLSRDAILIVLRETMSAKRDGPPASFKYFNRAMEREAARLAEPPLQPAPHEVNYDRQPARDRREAAASKRLGRILDAAAQTD